MQPPTKEQLERLRKAAQETNRAYALALRAVKKWKRENPNELRRYST